MTLIERTFSNNADIRIDDRMLEDPVCTMLETDERNVTAVKTIQM